MKQLLFPLGGILVIVVFLMHFFYAWDPYHITEALMAVLLTACLHNRMFKLTLVDVAVLLLWLYMALSPTVNPYLSLQSLWGFTGSCLFYFLVRCLLRHDGSCRLLSGITVCIFILSLLACAMFSVFVRVMHELAFESWYDFRFLYAPLGVPNNEWSSLLWVFGGIAAAAYFQTPYRWVRRLALLTGGLVLFLMTVSFSRGICLSVAVVALLSLVVIGERIRCKKVYIPMVCCVLIALGACALFPKETGKVLRFNETVSQQRSTSGRWSAIRLTGDILKEYPWGVGTGNYVVAKDFYLTGASRPATYTSYAPNTPVKVLVEGGYAGGMFYALLWTAMLVWLVKKGGRRRWFVALFLLGYFLRELTFSTFFDSTRALLVAFFLMALLQTEKSGSGFAFKSKVVLFLPCAVWTGVFLWALLGCLSPEQAKERNPLDVQCLFERAMEQADEPYARALAERYPDKAHFRWALYKYHKENGQVTQAADDLARCILQLPRILHTDCWQSLCRKDSLFAQQVKERLLTEVKACPADALAQARCGSVALQLGDADMAEALLRGAVSQLPSLSRAWFNLSTISLRRGDEAAALLCRKRAQIIECGIFGDYAHYAFQEEDNLRALLRQSEIPRSRIWYGGQ